MFRIFDNSAQTLPAFVKPYPDELLSSWLVRLSFEHGLNKSMLLRQLGLVKEASKIDKCNDDRELSMLANLANCTIQEIREMTLESYRNKLFAVNNFSYSKIPSVWITKSHFRSKSGLRTENLLFCPSCLSKENKPAYFRKHWKLSISFVCTECCCYLKDCCPHCGISASAMNTGAQVGINQTVRDYMLTCGGCLNDISECIPDIAPQAIMDMQTMINKYLKQPDSNTIRNSVKFFLILQKTAIMLQSKWIRENHCSLLSNVIRDSGVNCALDDRYQLARLPLKQQANLYAMAKWLLDEWPVRFIKYCKMSKIAREDLLKHYPDTPEWFQTRVNSGLPERIPVTKSAPKAKEPEIERYLIEIEGTNNGMCNRSNYDYDPDEKYYIEDYDTPQPIYWFNREKSYYAEDLILKQMKKAWEWN